MIKNNQFFIKNLKSISFFGESTVFNELIKINEKFNIKTEIITSPDQSKNIKKNIKPKIFKSLDSKFKTYIRKKCKIENTLFISMGSRFIFKKDMIKNFFQNNLVNFHGTRLPMDSGGAPYSWMIMREDKIDAQLIHLITSKIDSGPIIDYELNLFSKSCKIPIEYINSHNEFLLKFYEKFIYNLTKGKKFNLKNNPGYLGRYSPRIDSKINGFINWELNPNDLFCFINAFDDPYYGASTFLSNKKFGKLRIKKVHLHGGDSSNHPYMSGIITRHDKKWIVVSTIGKYMLLIEEILDKNNKNILSKLKVGDRFFTPQKYLDKSLYTRVFYSTSGLKKN